MTKARSVSTIVDASYVLSLLLPDEKSAHQAVPTSMYAPNLLPYEVINGLRSAVLSHRITLTLATALYQEYLHLPITLKSPNFEQCLSIAATHHLSAYDASYVSLSRTLKLPLITFDQRLARLI